MSDHIPAIYDAGVFRPLEPVNWPDGTHAEVILVVPSSGALVEKWPAGYFEQTSGSLAGEQFERPAQGDLPERDSW
jgi:predicted DNA-binding antitoxin AbrB/MazE fold protein